LVRGRFWRYLIISVRQRSACNSALTMQVWTSRWPIHNASIHGRVLIWRR